MEIRHVPSCYNKSQLPSFTSTQLVFLDKVHVKKVCGPPATSLSNECNIVFSVNEEGEVDVERGIYNTNNQPKRATFKYEQEGQFYLSVAKVEGQYGTIIGKRCPVFDYTEKKIVMINAYKKEIMNELERIRSLLHLCQNEGKWKEARQRQTKQ